MKYKSKIIIKIIGVLIVIILMVLAFVYIDKIEEFSFDLVLSENMQNIDDRIDNMMEKTDTASITSVELVEEGTDSTNPLGKTITINDTPAFFLNDRAVDVEEGEELTFTDYASDQLMAVLIYGYPNLSPEDVGLSTETEFYQATQIALLEVAARTGEAYNDMWESSRLKTLKSQWGKNINNKVFAVAKKLIEQAEDNPYTTVPGITISGDVGAMIDDENQVIIIGPYVVTIQDDCYQYNPKITSIELTDSNGNEVEHRIVDILENELDSPEYGEDFYIEIPLEYSIGEFNLQIRTAQDKVVGQLFESGDKSYVVTSKLSVECDGDVTIKTNGISDTLNKRINN